MDTKDQYLKRFESSTPSMMLSTAFLRIEHLTELMEPLQMEEGSQNMEKKMGPVDIFKIKHSLLYLFRPSYSLKLDQQLTCEKVCWLSQLCHVPYSKSDRDKAS